MPSASSLLCVWHPMESSCQSYQPKPRQPLARKSLAAISAPANRLVMPTWHSCTTDCKRQGGGCLWSLFSDGLMGNGWFMAETKRICKLHGIFWQKKRISSWISQPIGSVEDWYKCITGPPLHWPHEKKRKSRKHKLFPFLFSSKHPHSPCCLPLSTVLSSLFLYSGKTLWNCNINLLGRNKLWKLKNCRVQPPLCYSAEKFQLPTSSMNVILNNCLKFPHTHKIP